MLDPFADLTLPKPGSTSARRLLGLYLKQTLADLFSLPMGRFRSAIFDDFSDVRGVVERLLRERKAGLSYALVRRVTHSTLIRCLHNELWGGGDVEKLDSWLSELTALLALELARAGELPPDGIRFRSHPARLTSLGGNFALDLQPDDRLGVRPGRLLIERGGRQLELDLDSLESADPAQHAELGLLHPYHQVVDAVVLGTLDNNPLSDFEAHPDKSGNQLDLGGQSLERWLQQLRDAFELVDAHLPELGAEFRLVMQTLIPVGYDEQRHLSASYAEAIGTAYLTLHPDLMTMAEALIHEFSHNKVNALFRLDPVLENAFSPLYTSPVRPDPRPLHGILLAVHAFIPVARLYERMGQAEHPLSKSPRFSQRFSEIARKNHEGISTLSEHAKPTPAGKSLLGELERWDAHYASRYSAAP